MLGVYTHFEGNNEGGVGVISIALVLWRPGCWKRFFTAWRSCEIDFISEPALTEKSFREDPMQHAKQVPCLVTEKKKIKIKIVKLTELTARVTQCSTKNRFPVGHFT